MNRAYSLFLILMVHLRFIFSHLQNWSSLTKDIALKRPTRKLNRRLTVSWKWQPADFDSDFDDSEVSGTHVMYSGIFSVFLASSDILLWGQFWRHFVRPVLTSFGDLVSFLYARFLCYSVLLNVGYAWICSKISKRSMHTASHSSAFIIFLWHFYTIWWQHISHQ